MRNLVYLPLAIMGLTACSAVNQAPQYNAQYKQQSQDAYFQQQPAFGQPPIVQPPTYYPAAQNSQANPYTQQIQYAQPAQYNRAPQNLRRNPTPHTPALRGPHRPRGHAGYFYGTVGVVNYDTDIDNYGLEGRLGYQATKNFGVEAEGSVGIIDDNDTFDIPTIGVLRTSAGFNGNAAVFGVARLPVSDRIALHGRAGYDFRSYDNEIRDELGNTIRDGGNLDGFAYGFGGEYALTPRNRLRIDYTFYESDLGTSDAVSLSYKRKF